MKRLVDWIGWLDYPQQPNFDVSTDAFNTLRELLLRHKVLIHFHVYF